MDPITIGAVISGFSSSIFNALGVGDGKRALATNQSISLAGLQNSQLIESNQKENEANMKKNIFIFLGTIVFIVFLVLIVKMIKNKKQA